MPRHDVQCTKCGTIIRNHELSPWPDKLLHEDGGELEILWHFPSPRGTAAVHPSERSVVWRNPKTGEVAYPPRNDVDMPARYRQRGFQREEFESARSLEKFEQEKGVRCEGLWYNSGNGIN